MDNTTNAPLPAATPNDAGTEKKRKSLYSYAQLQKMWALPLKHKIAIAKKIIRQTFRRGNKIALAFSGGKDSTALWHLIRETRTALHPAAARPPGTPGAEGLVAWGKAGT